jgi:hypothetical protein
VGGARAAARRRVTREPVMAKADDETTSECEQFRELFTRRMSIRDLRPDPVPDAYLDKILEAGRWAGSHHVTIHIQEPFKRVLDVPDLLMIDHILPIGFSDIDRRPTVRRPLGESVHHDRYNHGKYMPNRQVLGFLHELRGRTMPVCHTRLADEV